jgi:hypothetical protein
MNDKPDILDFIQQTGHNRTGEDRGPEEVVSDFPLYGFSKRVEALDALDEHMRTVDTSDLRKYSRLVGMRRELGEIHHTLRKAGR